MCIRDRLGPGALGGSDQCEVSALIIVISAPASCLLLRSLHSFGRSRGLGNDCGQLGAGGGGNG
eukprot:2444766-Alexandrium_andersonii.AAC.1